MSASTHIQKNNLRHQQTPLPNEPVASQYATERQVSEGSPFSSPGVFPADCPHVSRILTAACDRDEYRTAVRGVSRIWFSFTKAEPYAGNSSHSSPVLVADT